jgi:hypothetical protein
MSLWRAFKYFAIGVGLNIVLSLVLRTLGANLIDTFYWPWLGAGEWVLPSGSGGHAMPGGAMLGILVGFITYSLLLGFAVLSYINWRTEKL